MCLASSMPVLWIAGIEGFDRSWGSESQRCALKWVRVAPGIPWSGQLSPTESLFCANSRGGVSRGKLTELGCDSNRLCSIVQERLMSCASCQRLGVIGPGLLWVLGPTSGEQGDWLDIGWRGEGPGIKRTMKNRSKVHSMGFRTWVDAWWTLMFGGWESKSCIRDMCRFNCLRQQ